MYYSSDGICYIIPSSVTQFNCKTAMDAESECRDASLKAVAHMQDDLNVK
jgi:hypothetical protein